MVQPTRTRIAAEEYFQLPEYEQHDLIQLIDGEVIIGMAPIPKHQDTVRDILFLFTLVSRNKGGITYSIKCSAVVPIIKRCDLNVIKREFPNIPAGSPILNHGRKKFFVSVGISSVAFALIPQSTLNGEWN